VAPRDGFEPPTERLTVTDSVIFQILRKLKKLYKHWGMARDPSKEGPGKISEGCVARNTFFYRHSVAIEADENRKDINCEHAKKLSAAFLSRQAHLCTNYIRGCLTATGVVKK
jgi:hypothetical protein